jgi:hypothetical protein
MEQLFAVSRGEYSEYRIFGWTVANTSLFVSNEETVRQEE